MIIFCYLDLSYIIDHQILIWETKDIGVPTSPSSVNEMEIDREENYGDEVVDWVVAKSLRGHCADVYDLSWSHSSPPNYLVSGSIDNVVMLWDVAKGKVLHEFRNHEKFVRGVSWDPLNEWIVSIGCDKSCYLYPLNKQDKRLRKSKSKKNGSKTICLKKLLLAEGCNYEFVTFHDDNVPFYFSRLCFSPDGQYLFVPSGDFIVASLEMSNLDYS